MSILTSFKKLVDPEMARIEEADRNRQREQPKRADAAAGPSFACRVCGQVSDDRSYCPSCLADTMEPLRDR